MKETLQQVKQKNITSKKQMIVLFVLIIVAVVFVFLFSIGCKVASSTTLSNDVYINEIMSNNTEYADQRGIICDWVELYNSSELDVDISGYKLSDKQRGDMLVFPDGTIIKAKDYLLIPCGDGSGDVVAPFALSKKGNETLMLSDSSDQIIDSVLVVGLSENCVMERNSFGIWKISQHATPLFENDYEEFTQFIDQQQSADSPLLITEVVSRNLGSILDYNNNPSDWIEITNVSEAKIDLYGYLLSNDISKPFKYSLPSRVLEPNQSIIIFASGDDTEYEEEIHSNFKISSAGDNLYLYSWRGTKKDEVNIPQMPDNYSYSRTDAGDFTVTPNHTPYLNNNSISNSADEYSDLYISEICAVNRSGIIDNNGDWSDWIELTNGGDTDVNLNGCWLSVDADNVFEYPLPNINIMQGESILIFASGAEQFGDELHANFKLSAYEEVINIYTRDGCLIDKFEYSKAKEDASYIRENKDGNIEISDYITPGYSNTLAGNSAYMQSINRESPLLINEVMTSNSEYLPQALGRCYDWVEFINVSESPLNIGDYSLSDSLSHPEICKLPDVTLNSGEMFIVICSGNSQNTNNNAFHGDFSLDAEYSCLYLFNANYEAVDWITLNNISSNTSYGRLPNDNGFYYFQTPTPYGENYNGSYTIAESPESSLECGVYSDVEKLSVELFASGDIYYTFDGTEPNAFSKKYTTPLEIEESSVIRAVSLQSDVNKSKVTTLSYFLNVDHSLPILSLTVNPEDLFSDSTGIYVKGNSDKGNYYNDWEKNANLSYYDGDDEGFSIDCGLKMHGSGSRASDNKKSMKVIFRSEYGKSSLVYDLFGDETPNEFTSLVLRAGEDYRYTVFRSDLITGLAKDANPNVLTQTHKYCVLYVNGEYFGIFSLMERFDEYYYAGRYNVTPESVTIVDAIDIEQSSFNNLLDYCKKNDMRLKENYEYIEERVDIDNLIDWCIFQAYAGNTDIPNNVRVIKSSEGDGKWRYCFYDLDWTMRNTAPTFERIFNGAGTVFLLPKFLIVNDEFIEKLQTRAEELRFGVLSNENVLGKINEYDQLLINELPNDREKWGLSMTSYYNNLEELKSVVRDYDRWDSLMSSLQKYVS